MLNTFVLDTLATRNGLEPMAFELFGIFCNFAQGFSSKCQRKHGNQHVSQDVNEYVNQHVRQNVDEHVSGVVKRNVLQMSNRMYS